MILSAASRSALADIPDGLHEQRNVAFVIVNAERRPHGGFVPEAAKDGLCTMVAGANRDASSVEILAEERGV